VAGLRWWERLADVIRDPDDGLGFFPSKAETDDIWMQHKGDHYEMIGVYVDNLIIISKNPQLIIDCLTMQHKFTLKGMSSISYHLGCDYFYDLNGTMCYGPKRYIDKLHDSYERMFGSKPASANTPLVEGDHPELDTSELLDLTGIKQFQSLIGSAQWAVQLGRLDITTAVMTMSSFRAAPRQGHLARAKRIIEYLVKTRNATIRVRTELPDLSDLPDPKHDWSYLVYEGAKEIIPDDAPEPLGRQVKLISYVDANLFHNVATGWSVTGILHMINGTPFDWYSKKQSMMVETEFVAAKTAAEHMIGNRSTLRYLRVPIDGKSFLFGDNKSVVTSGSIPHSNLSKRHVALSYHKVRETIAAGVMNFYWIHTSENPADVLSKHWARHKVADHLHQLLFMPEAGRGQDGKDKDNPEE
jgi:hypothetical protein